MSMLETPSDYFKISFFTFTGDNRPKECAINMEYIASGHLLNGLSLNNWRVIFKRTLISNKHHCSIMGVIMGAFIIDFFSY